MSDAAAIDAVAPSAGLLERDLELAEIERLSERASAGIGVRVVVEGPAGAGKTRLLDAAAQIGRAHGMRVLAATGTELEQELGFGIVRSLFEPLLVQIGSRRRRDLLSGAAGLAAPVVWPGRGIGASATDPASVLHGLYWLVSNVAERDRLMLVVDDVQWADGPSLRFLGYLARRLTDMPVLLLVAQRANEPSAQADLIRVLSAGTTVEVLRPGPLSEAAVGRLVADRVGSNAAPEFVAACHVVTGGNPFLVGELLTALVSDGVAATADHASLVEKIGPETVSRAVLARVSRVGHDARAVTDALAVLGGRSDLNTVARLGGLDPTTAALASDALLNLAVLRPTRPLQFVHPLVRAAIYEAIPPGRRSSMHRAAARLLAADPATIDIAAVHLLNAEPAHEVWAVEVLRAAAQEAASRGAPGQAAAYLRRALADSATYARDRLLQELGTVELLARDVAATDHLAQALEATADPAARGEIALLLGRAAVSTGRLADARELLAPVITDLAGPDSPVLARLEAYRSVAGVWDPRFADELRRDLPRLRSLAERSGKAGRSLLLLIAFRSAFDGGDHAEILDLVDRGLDHGRLVRDESAESIEVTWATRALTFIDELDRADELVAEMVADARGRGSVMGYAAASAWRAAVALRRGLAEQAEVDARAAVDLVVSHGLYFIAPHAYSFLGEALIELGDLDGAATLLEHADLGPMRGTRPEARFLNTRARARLARGDSPGAIKDLRARQADDPLGFPNPNVLAWRSTLALALSGDSHDEALTLVEEELELARRIGQPRGIGVALRARALLCRGEEQIALLTEAIEVLGACPSRLELARATTDLGAALRRAGLRREARTVLGRGLDLAAECGARALAARARSELVTAGARPRRERLHGVAALTASERRVAEMAAADMTNREIAESLFVTMKAVAGHLTQAYAKLEVAGRAELRDALDQASANHGVNASS